MNEKKESKEKDEVLSAKAQYEIKRMIFEVCQDVRTIENGHATWEDETHFFVWIAKKMVEAAGYEVVKKP